MRAERVSEVERAVCAHWKQGGCGTLGESTHNLSVGECVNMRTWGWRGRWGRDAYCLVCSGLVCSSRLCPGPSWGPQATWERNITCRHECWQDQVTSLSAIFHLESSLLLSVCFHQLWVSLQTLPPQRALVFHPWLNHDSGLFSGGSELAKTIPARMDLGLPYGSSSSSPSPVRIRSVLQKEAVCGGRAGGWQSSVG